ncbi:winged helix-turn-helix domain-containing protein [Halobacterium litoreum]|uniref:Winged helix-turn-helix domain-containing protein n=1 Tax=Halobacterium litoreum TaxID=2039234 RepID=A0ABD5NI48_9EURY|nr:winged helix-turn-helix domain-containing protein [Halobacterium litoreum]UHH12367.1 winged helix-turn-helix domain-containing protein [Halobacterium litoreum]
MTDADAAADAFDVLSDPSRVAILCELADRVHAIEGNPVEFSELRRATGFDDAGRFNYHLGKLRDRFVVKREDGYVPTAVGLKAIGSVEAGTYTNDLEARSGTIDYDCPSCGDPLTATYEDQTVTVECESEANATTVQTAVPPAAAADATIEDIVAFVVGDIQRDVEALVDGVCPMCSGRVVTGPIERGEAAHLNVELDCENCWMSTRLPVGVAALRHPAVVALFYDHGVDVRDRFLTDFEFVGAREDAKIVVEDPVEVELTVSVGGDAVTLRIDDDLDVREV